MERQRQAAVAGNPGVGRRPRAERVYSRRDAVLLGASAVFTVAGAAMARSVFVELASPTTAAALPLAQATPEPEPSPIDVTPRELTIRILTEVPMTGETRDAIAAEAERFAPFGAGTVVTVRASWHAPDGGFGAATTGAIELAEDLFADDSWSAARRDVELPAVFASSAFVNLVPRVDNGAQLRSLGDFLTELASLTDADGRENALAVINPYTYVGPATGTESDWGRAREAMEDPAGLFAMATTTFLRFPEELVAAIAAMESYEGTPGNISVVTPVTVMIDSPAKTLAKRYLRAVTDLLTGLVPNPDHRGDGYVKTQLDRAFPRFGMTRFDLGLRA
ncbi:MAG TPA: hypothetical protein VKB09_12095 [Thermomicrobiales bacterium]|nr:hypothetical protein [Thermomicrobiales bacterium]